MKDERFFMSQYHVRKQQYACEFSAVTDQAIQVECMQIAKVFSQFYDQCWPIKAVQTFVYIDSYRWLNHCVDKPIKGMEIFGYCS